MVASGAAAQEEFDAATVFNTRCGACHTVGSGVKVGPDLHGVTERRDTAWLVSFIQSSQSLIGDGDEAAVQLFEEFGQQKMPDHDYSAEQVEEILAYIAAGAPTEPKLLLVAEATSDDVEAGRALYHGQSDKAACSSCHVVDDQLGAPDTYLGGSIAGSFASYEEDHQRDVALALALARPRPGCSDPLTPQESLQLRAFLSQAPEQHRDDDRRNVFPILGFGAAALLIGIDRARRGGRQDPVV